MKLQLVWSRFHRFLKMLCAHRTAVPLRFLLHRLFTQKLRKRKEFLTQPNHLLFPCVNNKKKSKSKENMTVYLCGCFI